jgi:ABC-2 type transport system ATP-binding protein
MDSIVLDAVHKKFWRSSLPRWFSSAPESYALKDLSLRVAKGETLGLLGPNGSGKTTTLKLISTLLLPDSGHVYVRGHDTRKHGQIVRKNVGFALASERSFFPRLTVRENLEFFAVLENVPRQEIRDRTASVLSRVGLTASVGKLAMKLSSGMHQRLAIARALIKQPSVLLLDEPTRSLDTSATADLWDLMHELPASGATVVLATHNFEEASAVCDRVAFLSHGALVGTTGTRWLRPEQIREAYLECMDEQSVLAELTA